MNQTSEPTTTLEQAQTRTHHKTGPSKMGYLDACSAFTSNEGTTDAAEQGTFLHDLMDQMLKLVKAGKAKTTLQQIDEWVRVNHEISDDEVNLLRFCCKKVDAFLVKNPSAIHAEISIRVQRTDATEINHGYLDVLLVFGVIGILIDFKFGWLPVPPAKINLQGLNYAAGCFQQFPTLQKIGICFIQPRLGIISEHAVTRAELPGIIARLEDVIRRVDFVHANPDKAQDFMHPGSHCNYCALAGQCAVLNNHRAVVASKLKDLPLPPAFKGLSLAKPEDLALARYWADVIENGLKEVKDAARAAAEANGGSISCKLPSGEVITYEIQERGVDRVLGAATDISEALKDICTEGEILAAAELSIGKLEKVATNAAVEMAKAGGQKLTKKAAWESIQATLTAQGLLSKPDTKIKILKLKKSMAALPAGGSAVAAVVAG